MRICTRKSTLHRDVTPQIDFSERWPRFITKVGFCFSSAIESSLRHAATTTIYRHASDWWDPATGKWLQLASCNDRLPAARLLRPPSLAGPVLFSMLGWAACRLQGLPRCQWLVWLLSLPVLPSLRLARGPYACYAAFFSCSSSVDATLLCMFGTVQVQS